MTVQIEDDETTVSARGGAVLLDVGCMTGDIQVRYASGETVLLPGPVCPGQAIEISDETASIVQAPTED